MRTNRKPALVLSALAAAACSTADVSPTRPVAEHVASPAAAHASHDFQRVVNEVRRLTQPYKDLSAAMNAGYSTALTGCMESTAGGMGVHYGDVTRLDANIEPLRPEVLMYEPQKNGKMRLVGVEYIVPFSAWTSADPPKLEGVPFHANDLLNLWALHVWVHEHNPLGLIADWNPRVTCKYAN